MVAGGPNAGGQALASGRKALPAIGVGRIAPASSAATMLGHSGPSLQNLGLCTLGPSPTAPTGAAGAAHLGASAGAPCRGPLSGVGKDRGGISSRLRAGAQSGRMGLVVHQACG